MPNASKPSLQKRNFAIVIVSVVASFLVSCSAPKPSTESYALKQFSQEITSSTNHLALSVNQSVKVPVTIKNPSTDTWFSSGNFPISVSFKWFISGQMLPIEGDRTALAKPQISPDKTVDQNVTVVAPGTPGNYDLQITLVQEGVAWFNLAGAKPLIIPATVN